MFQRFNLEAEHLSAHRQNSVAKEDMRMNVTQKWSVPCLSWQLSMGWMASDLVMTRFLASNMV